ncbi:MAG: hypothetical protein HN366_29280, partial [Deltaproteobacteria bacterium]|nr:hypothetical protein [Deltaproteobacteria bacterium]
MAKNYKTKVGNGGRHMPLPFPTIQLNTDRLAEARGGVLAAGDQDLAVVAGTFAWADQFDRRGAD